MNETATVDSTLAGLKDDIRPFCVASDQQGQDAIYEIIPAESGTLTLELAGPKNPAPTLYVTRGTCNDLSSVAWCEAASQVRGTGDAGVDAGRGDGSTDGGPISHRDASLDGGSRHDASLDASLDGRSRHDASLDASLDGSGKRDGGIRIDSGGGGQGGTGPGPDARPRSPMLDAVTRAILPVTAGESLFAVVDGAGSDMAFALNATLKPARCGDRAVNSGEQCDYGDLDDKDGCSSSCAFEPPGLDDACGADVRALTSDPIVISAHTIGYTQNYDPGGAPCDKVPSGGPDRAFGFFSANPGVLDVAVEASFDVVLYAMESCTQGKVAGFLGCSDAERHTSVEHISIPMPPNTTYHVIVDGFSANEYGTFQLSVQFTPL
jgi:cysteine-rich repeat protein